MAYDKAKWHFDAEDFPEGIEIEQGGVHIAFFYRWMIENNFSGQDMLEEVSNEIQLIKEGKYSALDLLFDFCDGVFMGEDFEGKGVEFADQYYETGTPFSEKYSSYLEDYINLKLEHMNDLENSDYGVTFTNRNYEIVKAIIDKRYSEYLNFIEK
ncbi:MULTISPECIES: hypothetical protein [unclassified Enterococcus]|uniref:DUF7832 domain-containing protein n=1 Tax=unclassified Enterococcus TaxID=2608891 RepID=UPI001CE03614|nr:MULTISPECIES: hypothetical protein [unclassified Enterococcus]MCA5014516.1 hypothetical protein [Enterococcus sp. S23]MCA5017769.1 hypothetical protein [Enterococcus sp. S22(2020)]